MTTSESISFIETLRCEITIDIDVYLDGAWVPLRAQDISLVKLIDDIANKLKSSIGENHHDSNLDRIAGR